MRRSTRGAIHDILLPAAVACSFIVVGSVAEAGFAPPNDDCAGAIQVGIPSLNGGSTATANVDGLGQCGDATTAPGVWYSVIGLGTTMTASTCIISTGFDTRISVFCGGCDLLVCVAENDNLEPACAVSPLASQVSWCAAAGVEYLILVHGTGAETGVFTLVVGDDLTPCADPPDCAEPTLEGACCIGAQCTETTAALCSLSGGTFLGEGTACGESSCEVDPMGACCIAGKCVVVLESICGISGGTYVGDDTTCDSDPCAAPAEGACCIGESCTVLAADLCALSGGSYLGDDTTCDGDPCAAPAEGACCIGESCTVLAADLCALSGGSYLGDDTTCDGDPCAAPAEGACCIGVACDVLTATLCEIAGGSYLGDDTTCDGEPCAAPAEGACCLEEICAVTSKEACDRSGGDYLGDGSDCEESVCGLEAMLDVLPGRCPNRWSSRSNGLVWVALLGAQDVDVRNVDRGSLRLSRATGTAWIAPLDGPSGLRPRVRDRAAGAAPCDCAEARRDGVDDLVFCFRSTDLVETLGLGSMPRGAEIELVLTARTRDGRPIRASDCIVINR